MKTLTHGKKQGRVSRVDICKVFADRSFQEQEFAEYRLRQPTSGSPNRPILKAAVVAVQLIRQYKRNCQTPVATDIQYTHTKAIDEDRSSPSDLPKLSYQRPFLGVGRNCKSNEPRQYATHPTGTNQRNSPLRQFTDFATAAIDTPKRRRMTIIDSYKAVSIQLTPRQKPLSSRLYLKKGDLLKRREAKAFGSSTLRAHSTLTNQPSTIEPESTVDVGFRPWESKEVEDLYL